MATQAPWGGFRGCPAILRTNCSPGWQMVRESAWGWPSVPASTSPLEASRSIRQYRSVASALFSLATSISTGVGMNCTSRGEGTSRTTSFWHIPQPTSCACTNPPNMVRGVRVRTSPFLWRGQRERVLQDQDMVFFLGIQDIDVVEGVHILFHVYLLRMDDIVLNHPLNQHREYVALGIVGQPNERRPRDLKLVAQL